MSIVCYTVILVIKMSHTFDITSIANNPFLNCVLLVTSNYLLAFTKTRSTPSSPWGLTAKIPG